METIKSVYTFLKKNLINLNKRISKPNGHRIHRFYKDHQGWFIDLPNWIGTKGQLAMVSGADDFLDHISDNTSSVWVEMSVESLKGDCYEIIKYQDLADGAMYYYIDELGYTREMWLCGVTEFVFGNMPNRIYCRKVFV